MFYFFKKLHPKIFIFATFFYLEGHAGETYNTEEDILFSETDELTSKHQNLCDIKGHACEEGSHTTEEDSSSSEMDDLIKPKKRLKLDVVPLVRGTSDGRYFESQESTFATYYRSNSHSSLDQVPESPVINVHTFLRRCALRLGIYENKAPEPLFFLPYGYDKAHLVSVRLKNKDGQIENYRIYDPNHELMNGQSFLPKDKALGGTRTVGFYSIDGCRRLCFKQYPEAPGHEIATYKLYKILFPEDENELPIPISETILMNDQVFLVSEFIEGETLEEAFKKIETDPTYGSDWVFNIEKFQKLIIFSFLINPEDGRPQNYIIKKIRDEYQFILLDNDRSLGEEATEYHHPEIGNIKTRVHCALLCFHEIFRQELLLRVTENTREIIRHWTSECHLETKYQRKLQAHRSEKDLRNSVLGIEHDEKHIKRLCAKLRKIKDTCTTTEKNFAKIFWTINPELAAIYQIPKEYNESPIGINFLQLAYQRIHSIDGGRAGLEAPLSSYIPIEYYLNFTPIIVVSTLVDQSCLTPMCRSHSAPYY